MIVEHEHAGVNEPRNSKKKRRAKKTSNWKPAPLLVSWAEHMPQAEAEAEAEAELSSDWVRAELNYWFISCPWMLLPAKSWTISLCRSRLTRLLSLRTHMIYSHLFLYCFFIISEFLYFVFCISFSRLDVFFGRRLRGGLSTTLRALFAFFDCFDSFDS